MQRLFNSDNTKSLRERVFRGLLGLGFLANSLAMIANMLLGVPQTFASVAAGLAISGFTLVAMLAPTKLQERLFHVYLVFLSSVLLYLWVDALYLSYPAQIARTTIMAIALWLPVVYALYFLTFGLRTALITSYGLLATLALITLPHSIMTFAGDNLLEGIWFFMALLTSNSALIMVIAVYAYMGVRLKVVQEAQARLESLNRAKSQFLATVSHELRTPLTAILGYSEILNLELIGSLNERQREFTQEIHDSGEGLLLIVTDILELANLEADDSALYLEPVDFAALSDKVMRSLEGNAQRKGVRLERALPDLRHFQADPPRLQMVLRHLLVNALKFTPEGGQVRLSAQTVGAELRVCVEDSGIGISEEDAARIFEPFVQADNSDSRRYGGSGLGLPLAKRVIELHGGRMWLESQPGQGSRFHFALPYLPADVPSGAYNTVDVR